VIDALPQESLLDLNNFYKDNFINDQEIQKEEKMNKEIKVTSKVA
jgi:hypothetical protein